MKKALAIITMILLIITGCGQETTGQPEKEGPEKKTLLNQVNPTKKQQRKTNKNLRKRKPLTRLLLLV